MAASRFVFSLLLILVAAPGLKAQEDTVTEDRKRPDYVYDVLGQLKSGYALISPYGTNFLAEGYELDNGFFVEAIVNANDRIDIGLQYTSHYGRVVAPELIGDFDASIISQGFLKAGYSLLGRKQDFELDVGGGFGYINFRNQKDLRRFRDGGFSLMAFAQASYRFGNFWGVYIQLQQHYSFMRTEVAASQRDFFNNTLVLVPSFGLKFYIL